MGRREERGKEIWDKEREIRISRNREKVNS
jgi:hypothetical protein